MKDKKLISTDTHLNHLANGFWKQQKTVLQNVIDLYNKIGLPKLVNEDLKKMFFETDIFLFDKLTNGEHAHLTIGEGNGKTLIKVDKKMALSMFIKPAGWLPFVKAVEAAIPILQKGVHYSGVYYAAVNIAAIDTVFCISETGMLRFTDAKDEELAEIGKRYIKSEGGHKILSFIEAVTKAYFDNDINSLYQGRALIDVIEDTFKIDYTNKKYILHGSVYHHDDQLFHKEKKGI